MIEAWRGVRTNQFLYKKVISYLQHIGEEKTTTIFFLAKVNNFYLIKFLEYRNSGNYSWLLPLQSVSKNNFFLVSDPSECRENAPFVTLSGKCQLILFGQVTSLEKIYFFGKVPSPRRKDKTGE